MDPRITEHAKILVDYSCEVKEGDHMAVMVEDYSQKNERMTGVATVGVGYTGFRSITPEVSWKEIMYKAASRAYHDAGIDPRRDVDSFITCAEDYWEGFSIFDEFTPDQVGAVLKPGQTSLLQSLASNTQVSPLGTRGINENAMTSGSKPKCFVIMPFKKKFDPIYSGISRIAKDEGLRCIRADKIMKGMISKEIINNILNAFVVVADLTEKNPNVFYELGIAHTIGKKTIMISQDKDIPFDLSAEYVILYEDTIEGYLKLAYELGRLFRYLLEGGAIDNQASMFLFGILNRR